MMSRIVRVAAILILPVCSVQPARAQWAVVDVQAIGELIQEIETLHQQLTVAQSQLQQSQQALQTMTGNRGMSQILGEVQRNYLPTSSAQLTSAAAGGGSYPALSTQVRGSMSANAVLSSAQMSALAPADQQQILATRETAALRQSIAAQALGNASGRFASLQTLIAAIGGTTDQKSILELQARISAELAMLQNEQTKLEVLAQTLAAQDSVNAARERERAIAGQGQFSTRFQPVP